MTIEHRFAHRFPALRTLAVCLASALATSGAAHAEREPATAASALALPALKSPASWMRAATSGTTQSSPASTADTIVVTNCNDTGPGSLRAALAVAVAGTQIDLRRLVCSTITLQSGALASGPHSVTLIGPGADQLSISGAHNHRVIDQTDPGGLFVQGLTLRDGSDTGDGGCIRSAGKVFLQKAIVTGCSVANSAFGRGGGIFAQGALFMVESRLTDNHASNTTGTSYGGGAFVQGDTTITRSTISGNSAEYTGGGLFLYHGVYIDHSTISGNQVTGTNGQGGGLTMLNFPVDDRVLAFDTISGNSATEAGGGIKSYGPFSLVASTIAFNAAAHGGGLNIDAATTFSASIVSGNGSVAGSTDIGGSGTLVGNFNLVGTSIPVLPGGTLRSDPLLGPLSDNGGPTLTHALLAGSPAIDAVGNALEPPVIDLSPVTDGTHGGRGTHIPNASYDQRGDGETRRIGVASDIGAYEVQATGVSHTVSSCADDGEGSLRAVISAARSGDIVDLRSLSCGTITLTSGALPVYQGRLALIGPGPEQLTIDANHLGRAVYQSSLGTLTVSGMTIINGAYSYAGGARGGCLYSHGTIVLDRVTVASCETTGRDAFGGGASARRMFVSNSTIRGNAAVSAPDAVPPGYGGGLFARYILSLQGSTVSDNIGTGLTNGAGVATLGDAVISGTTISGNQAFNGLGGGVSAYGDLRIVDSTLSGNSAARSGGVSANTSMFLSNSTLTSNTTTTATGLDATAGGLTAGTVAHLQSSIVFGNSTGSLAYDIGGAAVMVGANNLIGNAHAVVPPDTLHVDPLLGPLQDNGGPTRTRALLAGSPAIGHGNNAANLVDDQRGAGFVRVFGGAADIGAFENQPDLDVIFRNGFD